MNGMTEYLSQVRAILDKVQQTQAEKMESAAQLMAACGLKGHNLFAFGCSHAGLLALEMYYRSGGMATINPVRAPGLNLDIDPATMTSQMERLPQYGQVICDFQPIRQDDVVIIHSVSGRNVVTIDFALCCKKKGAYVIALTNVATGRQIPSRHPSGKLLMDIADIVLDNCGVVGDGCVQIEGVPEMVGPTSTAVGAAMLNGVMVRCVQLMVEAGAVAPVFVSANVEGGELHNQAMLDKYMSNIFYMG